MRQLCKSTTLTYHWQYNNRLHPDGSCNLTSGSMGLSFFGILKAPDILLQYADDNGLDRHALDVIAQVLRHFGIGDSASYTDTFAEIKAHLDKGLPVICQGNFTNSGHVIMVIGYDTDKGTFICMDPAGDHKLGYGIGERDGDHVEYPSSWFRQAEAPDDPNHEKGCWAHLLQAK